MSSAREIMSLKNDKTSVSAIVTELKECSRLKNLNRGKEAHTHALKLALHTNMYVANTLISMYAECGSMKDALKVFDCILHRTVVSWNCLLQGYVDNGENELAIELFHRMEAVTPNSRTYVAALAACGNLSGPESAKWLANGKSIHSHALRTDSCNTFVNNVLVSMYAKLGCMVICRFLFDSMADCNVVSWTALMQGYIENGYAELALQVFEGMEGVQKTEKTYLVALTACANLAVAQPENRTQWLLAGTRIHSHATQSHCCDVYIESKLVDMYARCGSMLKAREVFDNMTKKNVVTWNCLMHGYVEQGDSELVLKLFGDMEAAGVKPTRASFIPVLAACGNLLAIQAGESLHGYIRRSGLEKDLATYLVEFYGKCGCMQEAEQAFTLIVAKDVWAWNALLCGYSRRGEAFKVFSCFEGMRRQGVNPNGVTFTYLLMVCSHAGLVDEGMEYLKSMRPKYGIEPDVIHYTCMVDVFARKNLLGEAMRFLRDMPFEPNVRTWTSVLCACKESSDSRIRKIAFEAMLNKAKSAHFVE